MPEPPPPLDPDSPFWRFSCAVYAAPGVREACLALQDRAALDVNLALLCAWVGAARSGAMARGDIAAATALTGEWQAAVVRPLRAVRRRIKGLPLLAEPAVAAFRARLAESELEAERLQQAILFRWADPRWPARRAPPPGGPALPNLQLLLASQGEGGAAAEGILALKALAQAAERHAAASLSAR